MAKYKFTGVVSPADDYVVAVQISASPQIYAMRNGPAVTIPAAKLAELSSRFIFTYDSEDPAPSPTYSNVLGVNSPPVINVAGGVAGAHAIGVDGLPIVVSGSIPTIQVFATANYEATPNDFISADTTSGSITVTLPSAPGTGACVIIKKVDVSSNTVTVLPHDTGLIDRASKSVLARFNDAEIYQCIGGNTWKVISRASTQVGTTWETISTEFGKTGGIKFNIAIPIPNDPTGFEYKDAYSDAYWDFNYWKGEIDYAADVVHVNGIKIAGDGLWPDITKINRIMQIADYARDRGLYIHLETTALENGGTQDDHLAAVSALGEAFRAARNAGKPHKLIGVDLNNEIQNAFGGSSTTLPNSAAINFMTAEAKAWRTAYGVDVPVTWSLWGQEISIMQNTAPDGWIATMKTICDSVGLPFYVDWHPYAVPAHAPFTAAQYAATSALWPTMPFFFGEASVYAGLENQEWEAVYGHIADITAASTSFLGVAVYRLDVLEPDRDSDPASVQRRTELLRAVTLIPRVDGGNYGSEKRVILGDDLSTSLVALGSSLRLTEADATLYPGKVPGWRFVGDVEGVQGGDTIRVQAKNKDGSVYGSGTRLADVTVIADGPPGSTVIEDLSSHARVFTTQGTAPTVTTGSNGKFGEGFVIHGGRLSTSQIALASHFWMGAWIKPSSSWTTGQGMIMGQWMNGGPVGSAVVQLWYDPVAEALGLWIVTGGGGGTFQSTGSTAGTVPRGQWSYVVCGIEAAGYILVGTATGSATNVHLEDPGFPNGTPLAGDGSTPFTIGDAHGGGTAFDGIIDSPLLYNGTMPSADYAVPTTPLAGTSASDPLLMFALPLDSIEGGGTGDGSAHFAGPILPYPATLNTVQLWGQNQTAARGTLTNVAVETVYR
jgi:hypothetical protein